MDSALRRMKNFLIFVPAFYVDILSIYAAESIDKGACQPGIGDERNVEVYCSATYGVVVVQLVCRKVFRNIDHQIYLLLLDIVERIGFFGRIRPVKNFGCDSVLFEKFSCPFGCLEVVSFILK